MPTKLVYAQLYTKLYAHRAAESAKKTAKQTVTTVSENKKELTILTATSTVVYLTSRVAGFKAGYKFANNLPASPN